MTLYCEIDLHSTNNFIPVLKQMGRMKLSKTESLSTHLPLTRSTEIKTLKYVLSLALVACLWLVQTPEVAKPFKETLCGNDLP